MILQASSESDEVNELPNGQKSRDKHEAAIPHTKFNINSIQLPSHFSKRVQDSIDSGTLAAESNRCAFVRECVSYYEAILPYPNEDQYNAICKKIVDNYPCLKDSKTTRYWVRMSNYTDFR